MAFEDPVDGATSWSPAEMLEGELLELAGSPPELSPELDDVRLDVGGCRVGAVMRPVGALAQPLESALLVAIPGVIARRPADAVASAGLREAERLLLYFQDKTYLLLVHG